MARPTRYRKEYCKQLEDWMASGMSIKSFGAEVDCTEDTIFEWIKRYPEFSESYKKGISLLNRFYEKFGQSIMAGKIKNANAAVFIFTLKNKLQWQDKIEVTGDTQKPLILKYKIDDDKKPDDSEPSEKE